MREVDYDLRQTSNFNLRQQMNKTYLSFNAFMCVHLRFTFFPLCGSIDWI
jgi:hypothetical protein